MACSVMQAAFSAEAKQIVTHMMQLVLDSMQVKLINVRRGKLSGLREMLVYASAGAMDG